VEGQVAGAANVRTNVRDVYADTIALADYDIEGTIDLQASTLRNMRLEGAHLEGSLHDSIGRFPKLAVTGAAFAGQGSGTLALDDRQESASDYDITRADLTQLGPPGGRLSGTLATKGHLSGPFRALALTGDATIARLSTGGVSALEATGKYTL